MGNGLEVWRSIQGQLLAPLAGLDVEQYFKPSQWAEVALQKEIGLIAHDIAKNQPPLAAE